MISKSSRHEHNGHPENRMTLVFVAAYATAISPVVA
jgi:hypothetical protein